MPGDQKERVLVERLVIPRAAVPQVIRCLTANNDAARTALLDAPGWYAIQ
jgi:hypothetical protein